MWRAALIACACAAACHDGGAQASAAAPALAERVQVWRLTHGELPPAQRLVSVLKGQRLRWQVSSDRAGDLHVHGYRLSVHIGPEQAAELTFTAHATGRFNVEWHPAGGDTAPAKRHAAPLAVLEVRPP